MGRQRAKPTTKPPADVSPFDSEDDEEDVAGGGIPDDDGWIHLKRKEQPDGKETPKRKPRRRSD